MHREGGTGTELDDLAEEPGPPTAFFSFQRDARVFSGDRSWVDRSRERRQTVSLAPDEIFHAPVPAEVVVRLGKLRVSEFLADGREVTQAVLQAGALFRTRPAAAGENAEPASPVPERELDLANVVLMSLGEAELWVFPAGTTNWERDA